MKKGWLDWTAMILVIVGGLNWGLVGLFKYDLISTVFGDSSAITRTIFVLVGLGALVVIARVPKMMK